MTRWLAMTRELSTSIEQCELTHIARRPIDLPRARLQHAQYERTLASLGCAVIRLSADHTMPDSVFVEDMAVVFDELAVIARPGAAPRRGEVHAVIEALAPHRPLVHIVSPGTLDGGDVLVAGRAVVVGRSGRTNDDGIAQLSRAVAAFGYHTSTTAVHGCLHLKSAVTALSDDVLLFDPRWANRDEFPSFEFVDVDPREDGAANALCIGDRIIYAAAHPRTRERIEARGFHVTAIDNDELAKAEGAVTCGSLILRVE